MTETTVSAARLAEYAVLLPDDEPHADELASMARELQSFRAAKNDEGWQPIETAPQGKGPLLVTGSGEIATATRGYLYQDFRGKQLQSWNVHPQAWDGDSERGGLATLDFTPTHWMPLPDLPE